MFQAHGAFQTGTVVFRKKLNRNQVLSFLSWQPRWIIAMEACATAHGWAQEIGRLGHSARLIPPQYVKPYVKRPKNDMADAEAIAEAASRPTMRFVEVKSENQRASAMAYRTRQLFIGQRTRSITALRAHPAGHGVIAATNKSGLKKLPAMIEDETVGMLQNVREIAPCPCRSH